MDMDSASSHDNNNNWLAFSLSNNLFQPFNPTSNSRNDVVNNGANGTPASDLSTVLNCAAASSPKLEDFLGCANGSSVMAAGGPNTNDVCQLTGEASSAPHHPHHMLTTDMYDSELKSIAASFLRGYNTELTESQKQLAVVSPPEPAAKKAVETFGQRTSIFRGVTRHRWTGRYEAHLWDNTCRREGQSRKGRQVYLGGYDKEDKAARAYDLAALKYWGPTTTTNFPVSNYEKELEEMKHMTRQEFVASLRRKSSGFSRGASIYRGVTRHHQHGRWQARIGRVAGNKDLYLGTFSTQEEAAEAYDIAAIKFRGLNAVTNFDISRYDVKSIASSNLPVGGMTNKSNKSSSDHSHSDNKSGGDRDHSPATSVSFPNSSHQVAPPAPTSAAAAYGSSDFWSSLGYHNTSTLNNCGKGRIPVFQSSNPTQFNHMDHHHHHPPLATTTNSSIDGYFSSSGGGYFQIGDNIINGTTTTASSTSVGAGGGGEEGEVEALVTTRIGLSSNSSSSYGTAAATNYGNWISPSLHSFQPAKPNLSVFQTPIFGME